VLVGRSYGWRRVTSTLSISTFPVVGSMKPPTMRSVVVLPQPLGPSNAKSSPRLTENETPSAAEPTA
jgi:hypothetical protein